MKNHRRYFYAKKLQTYEGKIIELRAKGLNGRPVYIDEFIRIL